MILKEQIIELKNQGIKQCEIAKQLNCSTSTVHHHLDPNSSSKIKKRRSKYKKSKPINIYANKTLDITPCEVCWKYAEAICNTRLIELGYETFIPTITGCEIDLIAYKDNKLYRIQIKSTSPKNTESCYIKTTRETSRDPKNRYSAYTNIDWFLIYDGNHIYKLDDLTNIKSGITLRYLPPKINSFHTKMAKDYIF